MNILTLDVETTWQRFKDRILPNPVTGCWTWVGGMSIYGYGTLKLKINGEWKEWRAHRLAYILYNGDIPSDKIVCHKCDNPICVNPDHLFLGSQLDNMRDKMSKGREARGSAITKNRNPTSGIRNGMSKLDESLVKEIRIKYSKGNITQRALALLYGVSQNCIKGVVNFHTWRDV